MRYMFLAILLMAAPCGAFALTWDFADGSTYGWTAREGDYSNLRGSREPLHSEIVDGVWRIAPVPGRRPTVQLRSPLIGKDSALFDRLTLRLRIIHHSPTEELFSICWSNAAYRRLSDSGTNGLLCTGRTQSYPLEWEDITVDLRALAEADTEWAITWQDTLFNFQIDMLLYRDSQDVDNHPKFLELDWIQLTGTEELAQGELSPEDLGVELGPPGTLVRRTRLFSARRRHRCPRHLAKQAAKIARRGGRRRRRWRCGSRGALEPPHGPRNTTGLDGGVQRRARPL